MTLITNEINIPGHDSTPKLIVDLNRLEKRLEGMQQACRTASVALWPHIKTHKCVTIARRQLALGASGLCCAKLSEAEVMLAAGVRRIFLANSLATPSSLERAFALQTKLEQLILAVTSVGHARALAAMCTKAKLFFPVAIAVDTGLGREGIRSIEQASEIAILLRQTPALRPISIYTHEGHSAAIPPQELPNFIDQTHARLMQIRSVLGGDLPLWPGSSVTATGFLGKPEVRVVRPGAYVFGDLYQADVTQTCRREEVALTVRSTIIDRPTPDLALIDAGSKTFSSDRLPDGIFAAAADNRRLFVTKVNEEHGYVTGLDVPSLQIGETIDWIPAHVCPVVNLARELTVLSSSGKAENWPIEASGCNF